VLLDNGDMFIAITNTEITDHYFGEVCIFRLTDKGETWVMEVLLTAEDGSNIREPTKHREVHQ
jgi:hypothetical protein